MYDQIEFAISSVNGKVMKNESLVTALKHINELIFTAGTQEKLVQAFDFGK